MSPIYDPRFSKTKRDDALHLEREASKQSSQFEYIKPLIIFGIALPLALIIVLGFVRRGPDVTTVSVLVSYFLGLGFSLFIAMVALLLASKIIIGSFGPFGLAILRMAAGLAIFDVVYLLLGGSFNITVFPGLVAMVILAGMIVWLFDFDLFEGALVAIIICVIKLAIVLGLFYVT